LLQAYFVEGVAWLRGGGLVLVASVAAFQHWHDGTRSKLKVLSKTVVVSPIKLS
jgi:hypothetical protein